jgi:hypothetical protein
MQWKSGKPIMLQRACTSAAATTLPVDSRTHTAYHPNTVLYRNCSRHTAKTLVVKPHCCVKPHKWCRWQDPKKRGVRNMSGFHE